MSQAQYEALLGERGGFRSPWETETNDELNLESLDTELICETARMGVAYGRLDAMADVTNPRLLLRKFGLMKNGRICNGAAALFGNDFADYPQCYLRMARFAGIDKTEFVDSRNVQGNIFDLANEAVAFCFKHLNLSGKTRGRITREEALEVPVDALREAIINALAHRDYSNPSGSAAVAVFDDRVEISNPGAFPPDFPLEMPETSDDSFPHNPVMARVLYLRKTIETWGRGINLIFSSCRDEGRLPPSVTERNGFVRVVFPRVNPSRRKGADLTAKSPNKTRGKNRAIKALSEILPMGMRADARRSLLAVFNEVYSNSDVTIKQVEERTSLSNGVVKDALAMLKEMGAIFRVGAKKNGYWLISNRLTGDVEGGEGSVVRG